MTTTTPPHHQCLATLKGHSSYISSLCLNKTTLYSGSSDETIRVWTSNNGFQTHIVAVTKGSVKSLLISGDLLISAHQDHKIRVWRIKNTTTRLVATLPTLRDRFFGLLHPHKHVRIHRHKKSMWVSHADTVSGLSLSPDRLLLYSISWDRTIKVWRTSDFKCLKSIEGAHDDAINAIVVSKDGTVYTGSADAKIKVWKKNALVMTLQKHRLGVNALVLGLDGNVLYSGGGDGLIFVWEISCLDRAGVVGRLKGHAEAVLCLCVVLNVVCSGSADRTIRIWRREGDGVYVCFAVLEGHLGPIKCLVAATEDQTNGRKDVDDGHSCLLYSGSLDREIRVWRVLVPPIDL